MSSKIIYGATSFIGIDGKFHYVYRITNIIEHKFYYGVRSCNGDPYDDLGTKYFSSAKFNKRIIKDQKLNPQNYKYKIISFYDTRSDALGKEISLHKKFNVKDHEKFYNGSNQTSSNFDTSGHITVKDIDGNTFNIKLEDYMNSDLTPINRNKSPILLPSGQIISVDKSDPRFLLYPHPLKGVGRTDYTKKKLSDAKRGKSNHTQEQLQIISNNAKQRIEKEKNSPPTTCPHCGKSSTSRLNMFKHHMNNCKLFPLTLYGDH